MLQFFDINLPSEPKPRKLRLLLPKDYESGKRHYPVVYALDGQNLFQAETAFGGRHWKIAESMARMPKQLQAIFVAIDNAGANRIYEYAPYKRGKQGGGGLEFAQFLIKELKPQVDSSYRTLPGPDTTAIVGSSMGGLLSLWAGLRFGEVFGRVGVLSPSLWFNPQVFQLAEHDVGEKSKIYIAGSSKESSRMASGLVRLYEALERGGFTEEQVRVIIRDRGRHNEAFWSREFPKMHKWLFG
ncbi:MAG: alpha/beta hydrolase [Saprospiraceae bacterium]|nr:alpha/beta hydrolase [Saprospiraceae bacterium]